MQSLKAVYMLGGMWISTLAASGSSPGLLTYFQDSNLAGQAIVLVLVVFSFLAWTIMIGKHLDLKRLQGLNRAFERRLNQSKHVTTLNLPAPTAGLSPYVLLASTALQVWEKSQELDLSSESGQRFHAIENALQRVVAEQCIAYESKMLFLGTIISGAPFLGLLGTAWGVMDAFGAVSSQTTVTLQMLAPGVSGSLLTTVAALLVAIPSVFGYNYLTARTKVMITELENFASSLADRMELEVEAAQLIHR